jgi:hypothetical protein
VNLLYGTLAQDHLKRRRCAAAGQAQLHRGTHAFRTEHMHDIADSIDRLTVPPSDDVPQKQPGPLGRPLRIKINDQNPALREAMERQAATSEVLSVISRSPGDLQPVFAKILENAVRICDAKFGGIYRWDGDALPGDTL